MSKACSHCHLSIDPSHENGRHCNMCSCVPSFLTTEYMDDDINFGTYLMVQLKYNVKIIKLHFTWLIINRTEPKNVQFARSKELQNANKV